MPERKEDDRFDGEEFEHGFIWSEEVTGGEEEEEQGVEGQTDRKVVDDGNVQVASIYTVKDNKKQSQLKAYFS